MSEGIPRKISTDLVMAMVSVLALSCTEDTFELRMDERITSSDSTPKITPSSNQSPKISGKKRNQLCGCGCGLKIKRCPNGGLNE